jgi:hypothetical protein
VTSTLGIELVSTRGERGVVGDGDGADDGQSEESRTKSEMLGRPDQGTLRGSFSSEGSIAGSIPAAGSTLCKSI